MTARVGLVSPALASRGRGIGVYFRQLLRHLQQLSPPGLSFAEVSDPAAFAEFDLLHYPFFDLFFNSLKPPPRVPVVVTIHDLIPLQFPQNYPPGLKGRLNFFLQLRALSCAQAIITDSHFSRGQIVSRLRPSCPVHVVHLAPNPNLSAPPNFALPSKYSLPEKFVLYVGDINFNKGLQFLVPAVASLRLPLVLVGGQFAQLNSLDLSHPELRHLKPLRDVILGSPDIFIRLGFVPDSELAALYARAALYCQPSLSEGFSLPPLEALSCGCRVLCSDIPAHREILNTACDYFQSANLSDLSSQLSRLFSAPDTSAARRRRVQFSRAYSWLAAAQKTIRVYRQVLRRP